MSEPPSTSRDTSKTRIPLWLMAMVAVAFLIFSLSLGGLTWWLVSRQAGSSDNHAASTVPPMAVGNEVAPEPAVPVVTAPAVVEPGLVNLFNGRDLSGWEGDPAVWSVQDGVLLGKTTRRAPATEYSTCLFWTGEELDDFELHFSFRVMDGNNSGVMYHARRFDDFVAGGYQYEILRGHVGKLFDTGPTRPRRTLSRAGRTVTGWHEAAIIVSGQSIIHQLDGEVVCEVLDTDEGALRRGWIALELAGGPTTAEFKNIRLKREGTKVAR